MKSLEVGLRLDELLGELDYYYELMDSKQRDVLKTKHSDELESINDFWSAW